METKHTKGGWQIYTSLWENNHILEITDESEYLTIAQVPIDSKEDSFMVRNCKEDEALANAKLIASAPDMIDLLTYISHRCVDHINFGIEPDLEEIKGKIDELIKKATK